MRKGYTGGSWSCAIAAGVLTVVTLAVVPTCASAQVETGSISGSVEDGLGGLIAGATVALTNDGTDTVRTARTSPDARFAFPDLPAGIYSLRVTYPGFAMAHLALTLEPGQLVERAIDLPVGAMKELIRVTSDGTAASSGPKPARDAAPPASLAAPPVSSSCASPPCVKPAVKVVDARPEYPAGAVARGAEGIVIVEATVTTQGTIGDTRVLRSADPVLDDAAAAAIRQWEFIPTLLNGVPVTSVVEVTVEFAARAGSQ